MRSPVRWSVDGRSLIGFEWTAGANDNLIAFDFDNAGHIGARRPLLSQFPTLFVGEFDVARATGRIAVGSGAQFYDIWSFDLAAGGVRAERLTQGTNWHGAPTLTADGRALYFLRADQLGNSLYRMEGAVDVALTAEPQVVEIGLRLSPDERTITFESTVDSTAVLMVHDVPSGVTRHVPRKGLDVGWLLSGAGRIVWWNLGERRLWTTDADGRGRRDVAARPVSNALRSAGWGLSPDGDAIVTASRTLDATVVEIVPLGGAPTRELARFPLRDGEVGIATWARDGTIYLARGSEQGRGATLFGIDAATAARRSAFTLPVACEPSTVSVAPAARRAVCAVTDTRMDLTLIDGVRP